MNLRFKHIAPPLLLALTGAAAQAADCVSGIPYTTVGASTCTVPAGVVSMTVVATSGGGGGSGINSSGFGQPGGDGAIVTVTGYAVTPSNLLSMFIGGGGRSFSDDSGGGGGSSNVNASDANRIIAGGGGGGGRGGPGGSGGLGGSGGHGGGVDGGGGGGGGTGGVAGLTGNAGGSGFGGPGGVGSSNAGGSGSGDGGGGNGNLGYGYGGGGGGGFGGGAGGGLDTNTFVGSGGGGGGSTGPSGAAGMTTYASASNGGMKTVSGGNGSILLTFYPFCSLDIDGDSGIRGDTDGLLLMRYLLGLRGTALVAGAYNSAGSRTTAALIEPFIQGMIASKVLDLDGDTLIQAETDGLMLLRILLGFTANAVTNGAIGVGPPLVRPTWANIRNYLNVVCAAGLP